MKIIIGFAALLLVAASSSTLAAQQSCEQIKSDIAQRIVQNGVPEANFTLTPEANFTLTIVPNDQTDRPDAQVVGHCANDTHKILYSRTHAANVVSPQNETPTSEPQ